MFKTWNILTFWYWKRPNDMINMSTFSSSFEKIIFLLTLEEKLHKALLKNVLMSWLFSWRWFLLEALIAITTFISAHQVLQSSLIANQFEQAFFGEKLARIQSVMIALNGRVYWCVYSYITHIIILTFYYQAIRIFSN